LPIIQAQKTGINRQGSRWKISTLAVITSAKSAFVHWPNIAASTAKITSLAPRADKCALPPFLPVVACSVLRHNELICLLLCQISVALYNQGLHGGMSIAMGVVNV
jgi:hypothetical protein